MLQISSWFAVCLRLSTAGFPRWGPFPLLSGTRRLNPARPGDGSSRWPPAGTTGSAAPCRFRAGSIRSAPAAATGPGAGPNRFHPVAATGPAGRSPGGRIPDLPGDHTPGRPKAGPSHFHPAAATGPADRSPEGRIPGRPEADRHPGAALLRPEAARRPGAALRRLEPFPPAERPR